MWKETSCVLNELLADLDSRAGIATDGVLLDLTEMMSSLTFLIICAAGFGQPLSWSDMDEDVPPPPGYSLSFKRALLGAVHGIFVRAACPGWVYSLPSWVIPAPVKRTRLAYDELDKHLFAMVADARADQKLESANLFRRLLHANSGIDESLSDGELLSNMFVCDALIVPPVSDTPPPPGVSAGWSRKGFILSIAAALG